MTGRPERVAAIRVLDAEGLARYVDEFRRYLEALPRDEFPTVVALAGPLTRFSPEDDDRSEFMLDVIVSGLTAQRQRHRAAAATPRSGSDTAQRQ